MTDRNTALDLLAGLALVAAAFLGGVVLIPLILSVFLFFLLEPVVARAGKAGVPRKLSAPIAVTLFALASGLVGWGGYEAFSRLAGEIPQYSGKIRSLTRAAQGRADQLAKGTQDLLPKPAPKEDVQRVEVIGGAGSGVTASVLRGLGSVFEIVADLFLIPILALFLLIEKDELKAALARALGPAFALEPVGREIADLVRGFFFGNFLVGAGTAAAFYALFTVLHLDNRFALAVFGGFVNLFPLVGALLAAVLPIAQALLQLDTFGPALLILVVSVFVHFLVANLVIPKVVGSRINVNATAATLGLLFWSWVWGGVGLLLAVPLTALLRIAFSLSPSRRVWADLIAEAPQGPVNRVRARG